MKTVLTQTELAERWGVSIRALTDWRNEGVIVPVKGIPVIRYSLDYIEELEGVEIERFSPLHKKKMEREIEALKEKCKQLEQVLGNILAESSKVISM